MKDFLKDAFCGFAELVINDLLPTLVIVLTLVAAVLGSMAGVAAYLGPRVCAAEWADYEHRYIRRGGCQIKIDSRWVPVDNVKVTLPKESADD